MPWSRGVFCRPNSRGYQTPQNSNVSASSGPGNVTCPSGYVNNCRDGTRNLALLTSPTYDPLGRGELPVLDDAKDVASPQQPDRHS